METANLDDFRMENLLGKGAYASTYFGTHITTGLGVAMKVYTFNEKNHLKDAIDSEVKILKKLNHPNIVKLFQCFEKEKKTVLVLE
jgi:serine/threonine protein kinase